MIFGMLNLSADDHFPPPLELKGYDYNDSLVSICKSFSFKGEQAEEAREAGADFVGGHEIFADVSFYHIINFL